MRPGRRVSRELVHLLSRQQGRVLLSLGGAEQSREKARSRVSDYLNHLMGGQLRRNGGEAHLKTGRSERRSRGQRDAIGSGMGIKILLSEGSSLTAREFLSVLGPAGHRIEIADPNPHCICRFSRWTKRVHRCDPGAGDLGIGWGLPGRAGPAQREVLPLPGCCQRPRPLVGRAGDSTPHSPHGRRPIVSHTSDLRETPV